MSSKEKPAKKQGMKWAAVLWYIHLHVLGLYAIWLLFTSAKWMTVFYTLFITALGCLGVTAGAHRLWAHRSYEAKGPFRLFLMLAHTIAGVGPIHDWVLYHRLHHKCYGTDKDPYNHKKGFLYSHYISNVVSPNIGLDEMNQIVDTRDIQADGYVWFQNKFYWPMLVIFGIILPLNVPLAYWDESMTETIVITGLLRFAITANVSWLVNSAFLIWSMQEQKISQDGISVFFVSKSIWPAYHYMIPWDWKTDEFGSYRIDSTSFFIKMCYELRLITILVTVDTEDVRDMLHEMSVKKVTLDESLEKLKEKSVYNGRKNRLLYQ